MCTVLFAHNSHSINTLTLEILPIKFGEVPYECSHVGIEGHLLPLHHLICLLARLELRRALGKFSIDPEEKPKKNNNN